MCSRVSKTKEIGEVEQGQGQGDSWESAAQNHRKDEGQKNGRESENPIRNAEENLTPKAQEISGKKAKKDAEGAARGHAEEAHRKACAAAHHHPGKQIPAKPIRSHRMGETGRKKRLAYHRFRRERKPKEAQKDEGDSGKKKRSTEDEADHEERIRGSKRP
jgi:hypothetical protein